MFQQQAFQTELEKLGKEEGKLSFKGDPHLEAKKKKKSNGRNHNGFGRTLHFFILFCFIFLKYLFIYL